MLVVKYSSKYTHIKWNQSLNFHRRLVIGEDRNWHQGYIHATSHPRPTFKTTSEIFITSPALPSQRSELKHSWMEDCQEVSRAVQQIIGMDRTFRQRDHIFSDTVNVAESTMEEARRLYRKLLSKGYEPIRAKVAFHLL